MSSFPLLVPDRRSATRCAAHLTAFLFMTQLAVFSQDTGNSPGSPQPQEEQVEYRLGPGDVLSIGVFGLSEFKQVIRVSNSGKVHVPYAGTIPAAGMTISQLQSEIATKLREKNLVKEPVVQVQIAEYRAHPVYILGEVMQPGQFLITDEMYLTDLLSLGVGFNEVASPVGYLYRLGSEEREAVKPDAINNETGRQEAPDEAIKIDFRELYDGSHPELNLRLRGGDVLYVPQMRKEFFFVVGDVNKSGAFTMPVGQQVLVTQAIAWAGGPLRTARMSKGLLMRYDESGARQELAVDFQAILEGRRPDFPVSPNDIVFIPGSTAKTIGYGLLNVVPGIVSGLLIF